MKKQTKDTAYGCLMHDFGKIVYRAGGSGTHSSLGVQSLSCLDPSEWQPVLDCIAYHHARELRAKLQSRDSIARDNIACDSVAYIACVADNISAAADRRKVDDGGNSFDRFLPLMSVFANMHAQTVDAYIPPSDDERLHMPRPDKSLRIPQTYYQAAESRIKTRLFETSPDESQLNSLLSLLEATTAGFPSSTNLGESNDISLYDHLKTTAAIGSCISEYLIESGETDYKKRLFDNEQTFRDEPAFLLYTADLSGIQSFIYTIADRGALKSLRGRSFFLGLLMEHYADELLAACGLCRANLLYIGGGHCYLLLPNTAETLEAVSSWNLRFNDFLIDNFGAGLFLAQGYTPCTANELMNEPRADAPYKAMFRRLSGEVASHKSHRYTAAQLVRMNRAEGMSERECRICGRGSELDGDTCVWCNNFIALSGKLIEQSDANRPPIDTYVVTKAGTPGITPDFTLPGFDGDVDFSFTDEKSARRLIAALSRSDSVVRVYTKNKSCTGFRYSTKINVGEYSAARTLDELADSSSGIRRLAVCRMDVDRLGEAFVSGYEDKDASSPEKRYRLVTISRTAAFSRQMSRFFGLYINEILSGSYDGSNERPLDVSVVYSGGDDLFLVGAWDDTIEAALRIQKTLAEYTSGKLTISGGIGLFDPHFPIRAAADEVAALEERAKSYERGGQQKNALSLFGRSEDHTYSWSDFENRVLGEKTNQLTDYFNANRAKDSGDNSVRETRNIGNTFLYRLLLLLRESKSSGSINIARLAYQLARLEPKRNDSEKSKSEFAVYEKFAHNIYNWARSPRDRDELITAIYLYVYLNRGSAD